MLDCFHQELLKLELIDIAVQLMTVPASLPLLALNEGNQETNLGFKCLIFSIKNC